MRLVVTVRKDVSCSSYQARKPAQRPVDSVAELESYILGLS